MIVKDCGTKALAIKLYDRWRKRIFANDKISYQESTEKGFWEVMLIRGKYEFKVTLSPDAYINPNLMLDADNSIRNALRFRKECV